MLGRSARRSRGRRRTPPHGCTSGQPSTTSPYPRAPIRAGTAAPCRRICDARAAAGEEACWTSLSPAETAGGLVERAPTAPSYIPHGPASTGARSFIRTLNSRASGRDYVVGVPRTAPPRGSSRLPPTTRIPRNARSEYPPWRWPPAWTIVEARPMPRSRDGCIQTRERTSRANTSRSSGVAANCVCAWEPIPNEVR